MAGRRAQAPVPSSKSKLTSLRHPGASLRSNNNMPQQDRFTPMSISVDDLISRIEWMAAEGLSDFVSAEAGRRLELRRAPGAAGMAAAPGPVPAPALEQAPVQAPVQAAGTLVTAPLAGLCFLAPEPGAAGFAAPGASVTAGQTLCLIEAMKVMTAIPAPAAGRVVEILVADGAAVEAGQPLLRIAE